MKIRKVINTGCGWSTKKYECMFYIQGSVDRESNLTIFQLDATYSGYYISVGSSTCFGCWHPSSGAGTAVITASGIDWLQWLKYAVVNTNV